MSCHRNFSSLFGAHIVPNLGAQCKITILTCLRQHTLIIEKEYYERHRNVRDRHARTQKTENSRLYDIQIRLLKLDLIEKAYYD